MHSKHLEEIFNSISHGIAAVQSILFFFVGLFLALASGSTLSVVCMSIFGGSLIFNYLISTLFHAFRGQKVKHIFRILDHCAIYLLIAGTYTPIVLLGLQGSWGWSLFGVIWGLALLGIVLKSIFFEKVAFLSLGLYLVMGWLIIIALKPLLHLPSPILFWLFMGGVAYTLGTIFYALPKMRYAHLIWHFFVMMGSFAHVLMVCLLISSTF